jgi:hypothetical protein
VSLVDLAWVAVAEDDFAVDATFRVEPRDGALTVVLEARGGARAWCRRRSLSSTVSA